MENTNIGLKNAIAETYRKYPVEVFDCRHCNNLVKSSDNALYNSLLCKECFNLRKEYRVTNPNSFDEKAERLAVKEERYENEWLIFHPRAVVCASCEKTYYLVNKDYSIRPIEEQRSNYELGVKFNEREGKPIKPFKPIVADFSLAPKGWDNEILCKICLDKYIIENNDLIHRHETVAKEKEKKELEYEKIRNEAIRNEKIKLTEEEDVERFTTKIWLVIMIIIFILITFKMCESSFTSSNDPTDIYFRK